MPPTPNPIRASTPSGDLVWGDTTRASPHRSQRFNKRCSRTSASEIPIDGEFLALGVVVTGYLEREFVVADADVVAILQGCGRVDSLVLHVHAIR